MLRLLSIAVLILALTVSGAEAQQQPVQGLGPIHAELPDGRQLALYCQGEGSPTVIFDSGLGVGAQAWSRVQPEVARRTRACAFDRPGYGNSDEGPLPRDAAHIIRDLKAGLEAAGVAAPFVLVGHSMGGFDVRLFANLYPEEVVGLVLVDPVIDGNEAPLRAVSPAFIRMMSEFQATAGKCIQATADGFMTPDHDIYVECGSPPLGSAMASAAHARTALSEQQSLDESSRQVLASEPASSVMPVIVLTAGGAQGDESPIPEDERAAMSAATRANHAAISARSSRGIHRVVEGAPHVIQMAQPDVVVAAILELVGGIGSDPD